MVRADEGVGFLLRYENVAWYEDGAVQILDRRIYPIRVEFIAFLYSDAAAEIFAKSNAVQPIQGMTDKLEGDNKLYYSIYDNGAVAVMDAFAATDAVEGITTRSTFFDPVNSLVTGDKTKEDWVNQIKSDSDALRAALKE